MSMMSKRDPTKAGEEQQAPTDMGVVKRDPGRKIAGGVRISVRAGYALLESRDGAIRQTVPLAMVGKRFKPGEEVAYFEATERRDAIEIGDRLPEAKAGW